MVLNLVRDKGVPAFAYSVNDVSVLLPCSLKILHSDAQLVVSLGHYIPNYGLDNEPLFTLRYEGDNLLPGKTSLRDSESSISGGLLQNIARHGQPRARELSLTLKAPCSVWYLHSFGNGLSSLHTQHHKLLTLARATQVRILFDINWLGRGNFARLQSAVEGSRQLTGVPVIPQFTCLYQQADWSTLNSIQNDVAFEAVPSIEDVVAGASPLEDAEHDAPPSYEHVSRKRTRNDRTSLTPDSPLPKRLLQNPICALSRTERATSASLSAKSTASSTATVEVDVFQNFVTSAVERVLPGMLREQLPSILQDLLGPSPSPSLSPIPHSRQIANPLTQHHRTASHKTTPAAIFRAVINTHAKTHLQSIFTDALVRASDQASELHDSAGVEFKEDLDDIRLDIATLKEDHLAAFNNECHETLAGFKDRLVEEKEEAEVEMEAHANKVVLKAWVTLNMVKKEVWCRCRCKCLYGAKYKQSDLGQEQRAMSLPL